MKPLLALALLALPTVGCTTPEPGESIEVSGVAGEADRLRAVDALARECPRGNHDCSPAGEPEIPRATGPVPVGAAGFDLSMLEEAAKRRCTSANATWTVESRDMDSCSASVGARLPFDVSLQVCDANVCRIILSERMTNVAEATDVWTSAVAELTHKYGQPSERVLDVPASCARGDALGACVANGLAKATATWAWVTGAGVTAKLVATTPQHVFLFVVYSDAAVGRRVHARGL